MTVEQKPIAIDRMNRLIKTMTDDDMSASQTDERARFVERCRIAFDVIDEIKTMTANTARITALEGFIRALPQPTDAELDAAALARPVVRALVDAAKRLAEWAEQLRACGDAGNWEWTAGDEYSETIAALSAAKGAADADR